MNTTALLCDLAILLLVDTLGAPRFRTREAAQTALQRLGPLAVTALERGAASDSLERSTRCRWLLALESHRRDKRAWEEAGTVFPPHWTRHPWLYLDHDYYGDAVTAFLTPVEVQDGREGARTGYRGWRKATRAWIATQLRADYTATAVVEMMAEMAAAEIVWTWHECQLWRLFPY